MCIYAELLPISFFHGLFYFRFSVAFKIMTMPAALPSVFLELEDLACALPKIKDNDKCEDKLCDIKKDEPSASILNPSSKWSVIVNVSVLAYKSTKAFKKCGHSLQMLTYNSTEVSFKCHLCNFGDFCPGELAETKDENFSKEADSIQQSEAGTTECLRKGLDIKTDVQSSPTKVVMGVIGANKSDDSRLLVKSPKKIVSSQEIIEQGDDEIAKKGSGPVLLFDTRFEEGNLEEILTDLALLYPDVKIKEDTEVADGSSNIQDEVSFLKIRPLSELQNQESDYPSYSSGQMHEDQNPMKNIPNYSLDESIIELEKDDLKDDVQNSSLENLMTPTTSSNLRMLNLKKQTNSPEIFTRQLQFQRIQQVPPRMSPSNYHPQQNYILNSFQQTSSPPVSISSPQVNTPQYSQYQSQTFSSPNTSPFQANPLQQQQYFNSAQAQGVSFSPLQYPQTFKKRIPLQEGSPQLTRVQARTVQIRAPVQNQTRLAAQNSHQNMRMQNQLYQNQFQTQNFPQNQTSAQQSLFNRIQQFQSNSGKVNQKGFATNQHQDVAGYPRMSPNQYSRMQNPVMSNQALNSSSLTVNVVAGNPKVSPQVVTAAASQRSPLPLYHDPRLPQGWRRTVHRTEQGQMAVVLHDSQGRKFRSKEEVRKYIEVKRVASVDGKFSKDEIFLYVY